MTAIKHARLPDSGPGKDPNDLRDHPEIVTRTIEAAKSEEPDAPSPFDLSTASVQDLLHSTPPARQWLVRDVLPHNVVGLLGAAGGTGKSFAKLQLAVSLATGTPWLGMELGMDGATLVLSAEDDRDEIHRRLRAVVDHYVPPGHPGRTEGLEAIGRRVFVLDRVGGDNRLTAAIAGETARTEFADRVIATARAMPEAPAMIVLDPLARFDGGDPNSNADGTRLIESAEHIRRETGATVLLPHHVSKAGIRDSEAGQEAIRGASGLVDGARWVGLMATLRRDDAKKYGVEPEEARRFVHFAVVKGNYGPPWEGMWLERGDGGVLCPTTLNMTRADAQEQRADDVYQRVLGGTRDLLRRHGPMSIRHIRDRYAGQSGIFRAGDKAVRAALERAVLNQELLSRPCPNGNGHHLHLAPGDE
ncbi:AAA family ATPase [Thioalkalivibrio sp. ALE11]|uniref:AAA family ATPase n=1 Tax=Thioalkalivibrio sp. ALE11 TaxID=1265494 RepID=UPI0003648BF1|nr:AAA family ATPase [Thioalkalivibrio sp. ALE11]